MNIDSDNDERMTNAVMMSIKRRYVKNNTTSYNIADTKLWWWWVRRKNFGNQEKSRDIARRFFASFSSFATFPIMRLVCVFLFLTLKIVPGCSVSFDQWSPPCLPPQTFEQSSNIRLIVGGFASKSHLAWFGKQIISASCCYCKCLFPFFAFSPFPSFLNPCLFSPCTISNHPMRHCAFCGTDPNTWHFLASSQPRSQKPLLPPTSPLPSHYYFSHPTFGICGQITYFVNS